MKNKTFVLLAIAAFLLLYLPEAILAGEQSETGRHKPKPVPKKIINEESDQSSLKPGRFHVAFQIGISKGSGLFKASTVSGNSIHWENIGGASLFSPRFSAKLHNNLVTGILARYEYQPKVYNGPAFRFGIDISEIDVIAQAVTGQVGSIVLYDRVSLINLGLGWEYPLADLSSYPYVGAELVANFFSPTMASDLDQNTFGGRFLLGYHFQMSKKLGIRAESRLGRTVWGIGNFAPEAATVHQPEITFSGENHVTYFDVVLVLDFLF